MNRPNLSAVDSRVWAAYLQQVTTPPPTYEYDVRVGAILIPAGLDDPAMIQDWEALTRRRIDVIMHWPNNSTIAEIKPVLNMSAIGQVLTYQYLYARERPTFALTRPMIISQAADEDLLAVCEEMHIDHALV